MVPSHFADLEAHDLRPALWLGAPVLKKLPPALPFVAAAGPALARWDVNFAVHFFLLGGGWPADRVSPPGLSPHFLWDSGPPVQNLLPNQPLLVGSRSVGLEPGDFVIFRPWEGDAMVGFGEVQVMEGGHITGRWETVREGN